MQETTLEEKMEKFIQEYGAKAWAEFLATGKKPTERAVPDNTPKGASSVVETVKKFLQR